MQKLINGYNYTSELLAKSVPIKKKMQHSL